MIIIFFFLLIVCISAFVLRPDLLLKNSVLILGIAIGACVLLGVLIALRIKKKIAKRKNMERDFQDYMRAHSRR